MPPPCPNGHQIRTAQNRTCADQAGCIFIFRSMKTRGPTHALDGWPVTATPDLSEARTAQRNEFIAVREMNMQSNLSQCVAIDYRPIDARLTTRHDLRDSHSKRPTFGYCSGSVISCVTGSVLTSPPNQGSFAFQRTEPPTRRPVKLLLDYSSRTSQ